MNLFKINRKGRRTGNAGRRSEANLREQSAGEGKGKGQVRR